MPSAAKPPFGRWPAHHYDSAFGYAWWCAGGTIVCQLDVDHGTVEAARAYHRFERVMLGRFTDEIREAGGLYVLHDWRSLNGYDSAARGYWQEQIRSHPSGYLRGSAVCMSKVTPLLKMAVQATNLVASLARSGTVEVSDDINHLVARLSPQPEVSFEPVG